MEGNMNNTPKKPAVVHKPNVVPEGFGAVVGIAGIERRYDNAKALLDAEVSDQFVEHAISGFDKEVLLSAMLRAHDPQYLVDVMEKFESLGGWIGSSEELARAAVASVESALIGANLVRNGDHDVVWAIPSGQHHAKRSNGGGFCALNDVAIAALYLADRGLFPLVLDIDVHAGDGTQAILAGSGIPTISIHEGQIYPRDPELTDLSRDFERHTHHHPDNLAYNFALEPRAGDEAVRWAMDGADEIIAGYRPDVILFVAGADGATGTPLASTSYSFDAFDETASRVRELALEFTDGRVLMFSAGGYQPEDVTPRVWANVFQKVAGLR